MIIKRAYMYPLFFPLENASINIRKVEKIERNVSDEDVCVLTLNK